MIEDTNVLITGASSGIGKSLAIYYAENGAKNIFICGRDVKRLNETQSECQAYGAKVHAYILDITNKEDTERWILDCNKKAALDIVYANAGVATTSEIPENIYNTFNTNIFGVVNTVLPAIEIFKKRRKPKKDAPLTKAKSIVILSSIAGYHGLASCPSYSASKACVKAWGEGLRGELYKFDINVNVVCPGFVKSRITDMNTCPMPFFMKSEKAAEVIAKRVDKNIGLIAFPWPMRFGAWFTSILPNFISDWIYRKLPHKV